MFVKEIVKKIIGDKTVYRKRYSQEITRKYKGNISNKKVFFKTKLYKNIYELFKNVKINKIDSIFFYNIDIYSSIYHNTNENKLILGNLSLDYSKVLNYSLADYKKLINNETDFGKKETELINSLELYIDRIIKNVELDEEIVDSLNGIKNRKANSLKDALQRILFFNQCLWQTGHNLNGLGRLDYILDSYYNKEKNKENKELIVEFLKILHRDYYFKSATLSGDIGQIIELCGENSDGSYFINDLSYLFIESVKELQYPDPKILLRVSKNTPKDIMRISLDCIKTGIGCPLFANDDVIIPKLIKFGYEESDAYNYGTSACWEPYILGKSFDQNNMESIVFMKPFEDLLQHENLDNISSFDKLLETLNKYIKLYLETFKEERDKTKFEEDPLLSLFIDDCLSTSKDISNAGAKYNNYGFTGVALSNLVNSLLIVKEYVFNDKKFTLSELNEIKNSNFNNNGELLKELRAYKNRYGKDDDEVIKLSNHLIKEVSNFFENKVNPLGGKYKFGLSAPSYIDASKNFPASFDGRKKGEPFGVHISSDSYNSYTELIQFASKLDYGENRFNGNVVDFFVSPNLIEDNFDKFVDFLILSIKVGFFEMQMNVVSSKILIEARKSPEKFPNLIVRVWGFSSYFNDLPDEYKDYLIERAIKSESNS